MIDWTRKMWNIYIMEYSAAIKNDEFMSFVGRDESGNHNFKQSEIKTENQTLHFLTHK